TLIHGTPHPHAHIRTRYPPPPPRQRAPPVIALHRHPAARARVLYNILTRLRKRHTEAHRRPRIELQFGRQNGGRPLLNLADHLVHVLRRPHRRHGEQHVALLGGLAPREATVDLEPLRGLA